MPKLRWTLDQKKHQVAAWRAGRLTHEQSTIFQIIATVAAGCRKGGTAS